MSQGGAEAASGGAARLPIRPGLFVEHGDAPPALVGSRDRETGQVFFPAEVMNPVTMREGTLERHAFDGAGRLVAWTVIRSATPKITAAPARPSVANGTIQMSQGGGRPAGSSDCGRMVAAGRRGATGNHPGRSRWRAIERNRICG